LNFGEYYQDIQPEHNKNDQKKRQKRPVMVNSRIPDQSPEQKSPTGTFPTSSWVGGITIITTTMVGGTIITMVMELQRQWQKLLLLVVQPWLVLLLLQLSQLRVLHPKGKW